MASLLCHIMYERLFDTLRTKEQLGYSVSCDYVTTDGIVGFYILIQVCLCVRECPRRYLLCFRMLVQRRCSTSVKKHVLVWFLMCCFVGVLVGSFLRQLVVAEHALLVGCSSLITHTPLACVLQSGKYDVRYLHDRVLKFVIEFREHMVSTALSSPVVTTASSSFYVWTAIITSLTTLVCLWVDCILSQRGTLPIPGGDDG